MSAVLKFLTFVGVLCFCASMVMGQQPTPCVWDPAPQNGLAIFNPFGPCVPACNGTQTRCRTVVAAPIADGGCPAANGTTDLGNVTVGYQECEQRVCGSGCAPGGGGTGECLINGTSLCQNNGICYKDPSNNNQPACLCQAGFGGTNCQTSMAVNPGCSPNPCQNNGVCYSEGGSNFTCQCPGNTAGAKCELTPCSDTTLCGNSAKCITPYGICDCSTAAPANAWYGPYCNISIPANQCANITCKNNASCVVDFGYPRCACPKGWSGSDCGTAGGPVSSCDMRGLIECMAKVSTASTATTGGKCDSYTRYGQCAVNSNCVGPLGLWCSAGGIFPLLTGCTVPACSATLGTCNMTIFRSCSTGNSKGGTSCDNAPSLATCAAVSGCPDLLRTYCVAGCNNTGGFPPECSNWVNLPVAAKLPKFATMDFEAFADAHISMGGEAVRPRIGQAQLKNVQSTQKAKSTEGAIGYLTLVVVGVALVVVGMVVAVVSRVRRTGGQSEVSDL